MIPCVRGELPVEEGVRRFKRETQRFAKRQLTWFRADPEVVWLDLSGRDGPEEAFERIKALKAYQDML
jgi:tRNA dimethylallyltransferase